MRITRTLLAALSLALLAACASDPVAPATPNNHALRDGAEFGGSGNFVAPCGTGFCGSGNYASTASDSTMVTRGTGWGGSGN
ncbi:MAG: hypothetical protein JO040_04465 [Gemmatimonadetes bacterium]|nr:hypothetical protein [Gemmatimonadota bacterium]